MNPRVELAVRRQLRGLQAGERPSPFSGAGLEARTVRPYQEGESVRRVDWRVTARRGELHVRSYHEDRDLPVILVLDQGEALGRAYGGWPASTLRDAFAWFALTAAAAGHPVGVRSCGPGGGLWLPPARGQRAVRRVLAAVGSQGRDRPAATLAEALDSLQDHTPAEAFVAVMGTFGLEPPELSELRTAAGRAGRRHHLAPVWVDPVGPLPDSGLVHVQTPDGRRHMVDASVAGVRETYASSVQRWRQDVLQCWAASAGAPIPIRPSDFAERVLGRAFARGRRRRGGVTAAVVALLAMGLCAAPARAQVSEGLPSTIGVLPGEVRIVRDTLLAAPVLGSPVRRRTILQASTGAALRWEGSPSDTWETLAAELKAIPSAENGPPSRWALDTEILPWWLGPQALPELRLILEDAAGTRRVRIPGERREIADPRMPQTGPGPTWPGAPSPSALGYLAWLPLGLAGVAGMLLILAVVPGWVRRVRAARPEPGPPVSPPADAREALDRVMGRLRDYARDRYAVEPTGWTTPDWDRWGRSLPESEQHYVLQVVDYADRPRFRAAPPTDETAGDAQAAIDALVRMGIEGEA